MRHLVKYGAVTDGTATVEVPTGAFGPSETRVLSENDRVFSYGSTVTPSHGHAISAAHGVILTLKNGILVPATIQPAVGDEVVITCPVDDVSYLAGSTGVILDDGSLRPVWGGGLSWLLTQAPPAP